MDTHFNGFTPEAMRAFREQLVADGRRRLELIQQKKAEAQEMLQTFFDERRDNEVERRRAGDQHNESRQLFVSELRSSVNALLGRFRMSRQEVAEELGRMAQQIRMAGQMMRYGDAEPAPAPAPKAAPAAEAKPAPAEAKPAPAPTPPAEMFDFGDPALPEN